MVVTRLAFVVIFLGAAGAYELIGPEPPRCCSPTQWEADADYAEYGKSNLFRESKYDIKVVYDYENRRWAYNQVMHEKPENTTRLVFDHIKKKAMLQMGGECQVATSYATMRENCITDNATYTGTYHYGSSSQNLVEFHTWSYDMVGFLIRATTKVSSKSCLPIADLSFGVVVNRWTWYSGEPACVPWKYPERVLSGDCYRSHVKIEQQRGGAMPTRQLSEFKYKNMKLGVHSEELFNIPEDCKEVAKLSPDFKLDPGVKMLTFRWKE